ncbi:MAG: TIGR01777 family oxidoreductase [Pseudomonadota bacterium]|nr:TIGR01777 family oxidoreductase [Pseudomonadota bacterium]
MKTYLITGGTGFVGQKLIERLISDGHQVVVLSRNENKAQRKLPEVVGTIKRLSQVDDDHIIDGIINLAGEPIADKRWTKKQKKELVHSRVGITRDLLELTERLNKKPEVWINASAIGFYGEHPTREFDEFSQSEGGFTHELCQAWEEQAQRAQGLGVRLCINRFGVVLGEQGALQKMLPGFKAFVGGPMGDGKQWMSWVHIDDVIAIIQLQLKEPRLEGIYNVTAPEPVTNKTFAKTLADVINRPAVIHLPGFVMKGLFGEMAETLLLSGQKVLPKRLQEQGYSFKYAGLKSALNATLN